MERCEHPETEARAILRELEATHRMLREPKAARDLHRELLAEAQNAVERLVGDVERLERDLLLAARGEGTEVAGEPEPAAPALVGAVVGIPEAVAVETPDLG